MNGFTTWPMKLLRERNWISQRASCTMGDDSNGIVMYRDDVLVAAVALDSWSKNGVTAHIAIEDPLAIRHGFISEVFEYVFVTVGRGVMVASVPSNNVKCLKFLKHVGFTVLFEIKDGYDVGVDYVVHEMRKENCTYLRNRDGKEVHTRAA